MGVGIGRVWLEKCGDVMQAVRLSIEESSSCDLSCFTEAVAAALLVVVAQVRGAEAGPDRGAGVILSTLKVTPISDVDRVVRHSEADARRKTLAKRACETL